MKQRKRKLFQRPVIVRRVAGASMQPALRPGKIVVGWQWFKVVRPRDIVIIRHNGMEKIKRIEKMAGNKIFVVGDSPEHSTDSRHFGWVETASVSARVVSFKQKR